MKMIVLVLVMALLLCGCGEAETFETLGDACVFQEEVPGSIRLALPEEAAMTVMSGEDGKIWICDDYEIMTLILPGGDLEQSIRSLCGYDPDRLTVMHTGPGRHEWVWTAAGEGEDLVGRGVLVEKGAYHYCLLFTAGAQAAGSLQEEWQAIMHSMEIV